MRELKDLVASVDVDDTLVRSFGSKRIPMTEMVRHVRELSRDGVALYAWSSGGGEYAREAAKELGIEECFKAFLPKPNVIIGYDGRDRLYYADSLGPQTTADVQAICSRAGDTFVPP